jgi:hypothetical protein
MSAFTVEFDNQAGQLARLCEAMAVRGVNVVVCGAAHGDTGTVAFIADDERGARVALEDADIEYDERPALTIRMETCQAPVQRLSGSSPMLASISTYSFRFECRPRSFSQSSVPRISTRLPMRSAIR